MQTSKINIFDIAKEAGVSIATVSRALSDTPNLNSAKQRKVLEVVQKYNYKPSVAASGLNKGHSKLISIGPARDRPPVLQRAVFRGRGRSPGQRFFADPFPHPRQQQRVSDVPGPAD